MNALKSQSDKRLEKVKELRHNSAILKDQLITEQKQSKSFKEKLIPLQVFVTWQQKV